MSLPASQQRALDAIDSHLRGTDIRLASMFTVFTELTRLEKMPLTETVQPIRWWARAGRRAARRPRRSGRAGTIMLVPLLLAATLSLLLLSMLTTRPAARAAAPTPPRSSRRSGWPAPLTAQPAVSLTPARLAASRGPRR